ncbi:stalk domain-containing protein [Paenibacillus enshidis]|uniref:Stalk domain-containing protein n=1 Tax=Paenibacillus enshidis TaxID=1458439 RepID=A0ABV5AWR5_9BACL
MKYRKMLIWFILAIFLVGSLELPAGTAKAEVATLVKKMKDYLEFPDTHEMMEGDYMIYVLPDGDGQSRVFKFETKNRITPENKLRLYNNGAEVDPTEFKVDYSNYTITLNEAPYSGAELYFTYLIFPNFEWKTSLSNVEHIGILLGKWDGSSRVFHLTTNYILNSNKNVILYIGSFTKVPASEFTFNYKTGTIAISEKYDAPMSGSEIYFYLPVSSIIGTQTSAGEAEETPTLIEETEGPQEPVDQTENTGEGENQGSTDETEGTPASDGEAEEPETADDKAGDTKAPIDGTEDTDTSVGEQDDPQASSGETTENTLPAGAESPDHEEEVEFNVPAGEKYPGRITLKSNFTFTVSIKASAFRPTYISYLIIKNAKGNVVKRIRINSSSTTYSMKQLGLPSGGYYFYLKTINQSGGLAASIPQFVPINNESSLIQVLIEGQRQAYVQPPVKVKGSVLVPFRALFEALGAKVKWDGATKTITATRGGTTLKLTIGSKVAYVNGKAIKLSAAPQLINGVTMVPIRFIGEAFGGMVEWNNAYSSVIIFQNEPSIPTTEESERAEETDSSGSSPIFENISQSINSSSDIVFVIDVTGSMGEALDYVKETVKSFVASVPSGSNFAIVAYRDINHVTSSHKDLQFFEFTGDKNVLRANLAALKDSGGGDTTESGLEAIHMAVGKLSGSKNVKRIIFITDAPVHDKGTSRGKSSYSIEQITDELKKENVALDAIAPTSGTAYKQMTRLVDAGKGKLYDIEDASVLQIKK